jgi:hypothetical protein
MKLALRDSGTVVDILNSIGSNKATGAAIGGVVGSIVPGAGTAVGAAIGSAAQNIISTINSQNADIAYANLLNDLLLPLGNDLKIKTDTELIAWGVTYNGELKALKPKEEAGLISKTLAARYDKAFRAILQSIKAEMASRGYSKGAGIPEGRNPNIDTGYSNTNTGTAPKANVTVTEAGLVSAKGFANIASIGLIGALIYMLFGKK